MVLLDNQAILDHRVRLVLKVSKEMWVLKVLLALIVGIIMQMGLMILMKIEMVMGYLTH